LAVAHDVGEESLFQQVSFVNDAKFLLWLEGMPRSASSICKAS
jgi:hypothetical protein